MQTNNIENNCDVDILRNKLAILTSKIGFYFAKCDGDYDSRERMFIYNYIDLLEEQNLINEETKSIISDVENQSLTIESIVNDTKDFLGMLPEKEDKVECINSLKEFIESVIKADGVVLDVESANYNEWIKAIEHS